MSEEKKLLDEIVDEEEVCIPISEKQPIEISEEAKESEAELKKIAPLENDKTIKTKSANKKVLIAVLFVAINIIAILTTILIEFASDNTHVPIPEVWETFLNNWQWGLLAIMMFFSAILAESLLKFILLRTTLKKSLPLISINSTIICKYYDNITPLVSGGQPFEVFYLRKKGIPTGIASGVSIVSFALNRIAYLIISLTAIGLHGFGETSTFLVIMSAIGLAINFFVPIMVILFTFVPRLGIFLAQLFAKIVKLLHIVKNEEEFYNKIITNITEYLNCLKYFFKKSKLNMLLGLLCSTAYFLALYSIPWCAVHLSGNHNVDWLEMFTLCVICYATIALIPTPGGTGGAELSFRSIFAQYLSGGFLVWGMFAWRIIGYYSFILAGVIVLISQQIYIHTPKGKREKEELEKSIYEVRIKNFNQSLVYTTNNVNIKNNEEISRSEKTDETILETKPIIINEELNNENIYEEQTKPDDKTIVEFSAVIEENQSDDKKQ